MVGAAERKMSDVDEFGMPYKEPPSSGTVILRNSLRTLKSRQHAMLKSLIHLPSMAITLGVLSLTFMHVFWEAPAQNTNGKYSKAPGSRLAGGGLKNVLHWSLANFLYSGT
jgi:tryptophan synthase alpha subunit